MHVILFLFLRRQILASDGAKQLVQDTTVKTVGVRGKRDTNFFYKISETQWNTVKAIINKWRKLATAMTLPR